MSPIHVVELVHPKPDVRFDLTGTVTFVGRGFGVSVALEDESGAISIANETSEPHNDANDSHFNRCLSMTSSCHFGDRATNRAENPQTFTIRSRWFSG